MAIFKKRVEAISGLVIASAEAVVNRDGEVVQEYTGSLTTLQLDEFLKEGLRDASSKLLMTDPSSALSLSRESEEAIVNTAVTTAGVGEEEDTTISPINLNGAKVISVVRQAGSLDNWRECTFIPPQFQSKVTDPVSLYYSSAYNPVYTILDNNIIKVFPAPEVGSPYKVYYVSNTNAINSFTSEDDADTDSTDTLKYFPIHRSNLIVLYAGAKVLDYTLAQMHASIPSHTNTDWAFVKTIIESEEDIELSAGRAQSLSAEMQQYLTEYQWYMTRSQALKQEYITEFAMSGQAGGKPEEKARAQA